MSISAYTKWSLAATILGISMSAAIAQDIPPVNSGANPYRVIRDWAQLTQEKRPWGGSNGVAVDRDGKSVWATDRCSPGIARKRARTTPRCSRCAGAPIRQGEPISSRRDAWCREAKAGSG